MIRKLTLAVGFGAGYVLGAKAGKERYDQIEAKFRELLGQPAVQDFTNNVSSSASAAADKAKATVNDKVSAVGDKVGSSPDSTITPAPVVVPPVPLSNDLLSPDPLAVDPLAADPLADDIVVVDLGVSGATTGPILGASPSGSAPDVL